MKLRFEHRRFDLPFSRPVRTAHGPWASRKGIWIRVSDEEGRQGFGEIAEVPGFTRETVADWEAIASQLGGYTDPGTLRLAFPAGPGAFAVGAALKGLEGSEPPAQRKAYLPVAALLPAGRAALEKAGSLAELGFRTFKWKVGVESAKDEWGMLDDLLGALPSGSRLRLDANGAWDRRTAEQWLVRAAERPVEFVEQPIAAGAREAEDLLLGLANDYPTPIGLDESLVSGADVERWLGLGWPGVYVVKPSLMGRPDAYLPALARAKAKVVFSSSLETGIGAKAVLKLALDYPGETLASGVGVWPLYQNSEYDGPHLSPFMRREDVAFLKPEDLWNAAT